MGLCHFSHYVGVRVSRILWNQTLLKRRQDFPYDEQFNKTYSDDTCRDKRQFYPFKDFTFFLHNQDGSSITYVF